MSFTDRLYDSVESIWQAQIEHPFVRGIANGDMDESRFRNWVEQDYLYLKEFARIFAWGATKARSLDSMGWYAKMLDLTLNTEMELHREYAQRFGVSEEDLESIQMWPTTRAYTDFLVRTSADGEIGDLLAALLPCAWGYAHIGQALADEGLPDDDRYADWILQYSSDEFVEGAEWLKCEMNDVATGLTSERKDDLVELFVLSSQYEYQFWDMCWHGEDWTPEV
jgi:thiaminase/transcriptional activator TenA